MRKIRTAIIGLGRIAHGYEDNFSVAGKILYSTHLSALKKDERFNLIAASDISVRQRELFKNKVSVNVNIYKDYGKMLKNEKIDLLVVAVPTDKHYKVCRDALKIGVKNILCEKPVSRTLAEADKLNALAKRHRAKILVNYHRSYSKDYGDLIRLIKKKKWGDIKSVSVQYANGIFNTATHLIHLLEKMFGEMGEVQAVGRSDFNSSDPNIIFIAFRNKFNIIFEGVNNARYRLLDIDMKFEKARIVLKDDELYEFKPESSKEFSFLATKKPSLKIDMNVAMLDVYNNIYEVIINKRQPRGDLYSSIRALKIAQKAVESAKNRGKIIKINYV